MFFDLASLAKPLVTAPLALAHLDLDLDRREALGFTDREGPLTVRQLLSHSAGLPPWLPFTGEALSTQLARGSSTQLTQGAPAHPMLTPGPAGTSLYSDLGYRLLAELLEGELGEPFAALGARSSGLVAAPWPEPPPFVPQGQDLGLWALAGPQLPFPARDPHLPNDANARAGMRGHAGFGADPDGMARSLERWLASGAPGRMARDTAESRDGARWGLGLQRALTGEGRFGTLLARLGKGRGGLHVLVRDEDSLSPALAEPGPAGEPSAFWFHLGYTGPALFFRPEDGLCVAILAHRRGPSGELLDAGQLHARRWEALASWIG